MTSSARHILAALAACAAALVLGACTERQSQAQYQEELAAANEIRVLVIGRVDGRELTTPEDFVEAQEQVRAAVEELDQAAPPAEVERGHQRMLEGMDGLVTVLERFEACAAEVSGQDARAVETYLEECRRRIEPEVYEEVRLDMREADDIFAASGYDVPGRSTDEQVDTSAGEGG